MRKLRATAAIVILSAALWPVSAYPEEVLYNGIRLPGVWPPRTASLAREPLATPPYLLSPPDVIPIDVGRQLFVDDFLIDRTNLTRTCHLARYYPGNPVLQPDRAWEGQGARARATPFSDGVWFDPLDGLFKAWYWASSSVAGPPVQSTCYAVSRDGIHWEKPQLDVFPGTNIILQDAPGEPRNSCMVWLDQQEKAPQRRFKMSRVVTRRETVDGKTRVWHWMRFSFSPDGIRWTHAGESDPCEDRSTFFYNPFRKVWVFSLKAGCGTEGYRCRAYRESPDFLQGARWPYRESEDENDAWRTADVFPAVPESKGELSQAPVYWVGADRLDRDRGDLDLRRVPERPWDLMPSQLYNLDCTAYESVMLGLFSIWRGQPKTRPKINEVCLGFSRDGFHWTRPDRRAFCPVSENRKDWNWGNVQSVGGGCLVVGDQLYFYVGGAGGSRAGDPSAMGLATLRRDGFASMDAGREEGTLTTRPLRFSGRHFFVNVETTDGELRVEALGPDGKTIPPFTRDNCRSVQADRTLQQVEWKGAADLSALTGRPVRFRFHLRNGRIYSFWVSRDISGASHGFVAAGGPGFKGSTDTVGVNGYAR